MSELFCWQCGTDISDTPRPISRHATCPNCHNELHCCRACRHYDPTQTMRCAEDRADPPLQKENANFCEFFNPQSNPYVETSTARSDSSRQQLNALFGDAGDSGGDADNDSEVNPPSDPSSSAKQALDDLFKK